MTDISEILTGPRIELRRLKIDKKSFEQVCAYEERNQTRFVQWDEDHVMNFEQCAKYFVLINRLWNQKENWNFGVYLTDDLIGLANLHAYNSDDLKASIAFSIDKDHLRKGFATEAIKLLENEFFSKSIVNRIAWQADVENIASIELAKKVGYTYEGLMRSFAKYKDGTFHDMHQYAKLKSDWEKEQR